MLPLVRRWKLQICGEEGLRRETEEHSGLNRWRSICLDSTPFTIKALLSYFTVIRITTGIHKGWIYTSTTVIISVSKPDAGNKVTTAPQWGHIWKYFREVYYKLLKTLMLHQSFGTKIQIFIKKLHLGKKFPFSKWELFQNKISRFIPLWEDILVILWKTVSLLIKVTWWTNTVLTS